MDSIPTLQNLNSQQVPNSLSSFSCLSEPPDVGNWFSSYEYRSPDPDSSFGVEDSVFREKESQRDYDDKEKVTAGREGVSGEKEIQCSIPCVNEDNCNQHLTMNLEPFSSCSLLSEPPDIRNWFSSYAYESPESDTSSLFSDEVSEENKCGKERFDVEVVKDEESMSENVHQKGCVEQNSSSNENIEIEVKQKQHCTGDDSDEMKKTSTTADTSQPKKILHQCVQDKTLQHNLGPTKYQDTLNLSHRSSGCDREGHLISLDINRSVMEPPKLLQKNYTTESKTKAEIQHDKLDFGACFAKTISTISSTCTSNKENHGFVTTRKNSSTKVNDENYWKKPENMLLERSTSSGTVPLTFEKQGVIKRKALTEATNLQQYNGMVITGKWQCPQKRKPDVGPAMKQLGLERWVRRV